MNYVHVSNILARNINKTGKAYGSGQVQQCTWIPFMFPMYRKENSSRRNNLGQSPLTSDSAPASNLTFSTKEVFSISRSKRNGVHECSVNSNFTINLQHSNVIVRYNVRMLTIWSHMIWWIIKYTGFHWVTGRSFTMTANSYLLVLSRTQCKLLIIFLLSD